MTTNLQNAINKARRIRCAVKVLAGRAYTRHDAATARLHGSFRADQRAALWPVQLQGGRGGLSLLPLAESGLSGYGHWADEGALTRRLKRDGNLS